MLPEVDTSIEFQEFRPMSLLLHAHLKCRISHDGIFEESWVVAEETFVSGVKAILFRRGLPLQHHGRIGRKGAIG